MSSTSATAVRCALLISIAALTAPSPAQAGEQRVRDEGKLRYVKASGSEIIDEGPVHGNLAGSARVRFSYNGSPTVSANFTISGRGWSIWGRASGKLSNPNSTAPSFRGKLMITGGSGRFARASGSGELFGVFYRRSYALTVQAIGTVHY
jgi:hypothetical protein